MTDQNFVTLYNTEYKLQILQAFVNKVIKGRRYNQHEMICIQRQQIALLSS